MRWLGLDFGERRIGIAISDEDETMAIPLRTIERSTDRAAVAQIAALAMEREVAGLVLGEPRTSGELGDAALRVRRFGDKLARRSSLPVRYVDETLSSNEARHRLRSAEVDIREDRGRVDAVAAQIVLEEWLEQRREQRDQL